jgi:glycine/D-amino acid oxidase-like deaminating enzyme
MNVLIVDDSLFFRTAVKKALETIPTINYLQSVSGGETAIKLAKGDQFDLIVLDLEMPGMDGQEVIRNIRQFNQKIKILVFSSFAFSGKKRTIYALAAGANDFLTKPEITGKESDPYKVLRDVLFTKIEGLTEGVEEKETAVLKMKGLPNNLRYLRPKVICFAVSSGKSINLPQIFALLNAKIEIPIIIIEQASGKISKLISDDLASICSLKLKKIEDGDELKSEINSPLFIAGLIKPSGAILNPAKLARGMKRVVEELDVEVREQTVVTRITPGKTILVDTELGDIEAPDIVIATNAYSHKLGFFKNRVLPVGVFQIATEPLSDKQWESIGWQNRQGLSDERALYHYSRPTADGRIVTGGVSPQYYGNDLLTSGNDKFISRLIEEDFIAFFPQLRGLRIEHAWGGTTALTLGNKSSIGVMGNYKNIYYGVGYYQGVPSTQTAGRIIAELMAGEENDFTNHFVVNQNIPYSGPSVVRKYFSIAAKRLMEKFDLPLYR